MGAGVKRVAMRAGEAWLTELGDDELREFVALSTADVTGDDLEDAAA